MGNHQTIFLLQAIAKEGPSSNQGFCRSLVAKRVKKGAQWELYF
jgi:hypothetical protein